MEDGAHAKLLHDWDRASLVAAMIANVNRKPGSAAIQPSRFNPLRNAGQTAGHGTRLTADNIGALKVFLQPIR
jgi:hypothetical protein